MKNSIKSGKIRKLSLAFWLTLLTVSDVSAQGKAPLQTPGGINKPLQQPMKFSEYRPCEGTGCDMYILAQGVITTDTPRQFESFVKDLDYDPTIWFNSLGGDLAAAVKLGRFLRKRGYSTALGDPYRDSTGDDSNGLWEVGLCYSACSYAFLGGVKRWIGEHGRYGVHQFYGNDQDIGQSAAQLGMTTLAEYLDEMGVSRKLLDMASRTDPKEMKELSIPNARALNIDNTDPPKAAWQLKAETDGKLSLRAVQRQAERDGIMGIVFTYSQQRLIADVAYRINQSFRSDQELLKIFSDDSNLRIEPGESKINSATDFGKCQPWRRNAKGHFLTRCELDRQLLLTMVNQKSFVIYGEWGNAVRDVTPWVKFGTQDLEGGLNALLKDQKTPL